MTEGEIPLPELVEIVLRDVETTILRPPEPGKRWMAIERDRKRRQQILWFSELEEARLYILRRGEKAGLKRDTSSGATNLRYYRVQRRRW